MFLPSAAKPSSRACKATALDLKGLQRAGCHIPPGIELLQIGDIALQSADITRGRRLAQGLQVAHALANDIRFALQTRRLMRQGRFQFMDARVGLAGAFDLFGDGRLLSARRQTAADNRLLYSRCRRSCFHTPRFGRPRAPALLRSP